MKTAGILCIVAGLILTIYTTFTFFSKDKVLDLGRIEIEKEKEHNVSWSPILGIIILCAGGFMVWQSSKK
jgi:hypothetical protein